MIFPAFHGFLKPGSAGGGFAIDDSTAATPANLYIMDGADHESNANEKWRDGSSIVPTSTGADVVRNYLTDAKSIRRNSVTPFTAFIGFHGTWTALSTGAGFITLREGSTVHTFLVAASDGAIQIKRNNSSTTVGSTAAGVNVAGEKHFWEFKYLVSDTANVIIRKDGTELFNSTVDTKFGGTNWNSISIGSSLANMSLRIDNLYIDKSGFLSGAGFVARVDTLRPSGAGDSTQWSPSAGDDWECVDEAQQDGGTSYVRAAANDLIDLYTLTPRAIAGSPRAIQLNITAVKESASAASFAPVLRIGGVDFIGSTVNVLSDTTYLTHEIVYNISPATSLGWSNFALNRIQAGYKSIDTTAPIRVTQLAVEVLANA